MTKTEALEKVLHHGPMTHGDLLHCTKWNICELDESLSILIEQKRIKPCHKNWDSRGCYTAYELSKTAIRTPICAG